MFINASKTKSNIQLKGSEKKRLNGQILAKYAATTTDEDLSTVISSKSAVCAIKIVTHTGENVTVYTVDKKPMLATVYTL